MVLAHPARKHAHVACCAVLLFAGCGTPAPRQGATAPAPERAVAAAADATYWVYVGAESADLVHRVRFGPGGATVERTMPVGESAVVVAVSAPHREEAFTAARYCIDAAKASVPIWKHETWAGGEAWGNDTQDLVDASDLGPGGARP